MIKIYVDSLSELIWIKSVIGSGEVNCDEYFLNFMKKHNINFSQDIEFIKSDDYAEDIKIN